jgi:uncharacterized protein (DUF486 family)
MADDAGAPPSRRSRWALLALTLVFNGFATYYYLAMANVTNPVVLFVGLVILWGVWAALLIVTLTARPAGRIDRLSVSAATACVAVSGALSFLV